MKIKLLLIITCIVMLLGYLTLKTSIPIQYFFNQLNYKDIKIEGIKGTLISPITLSKVIIRGKNAEYIIKDLKITSFSLLTFALNKKLHVENISIPEIDIEVIDLDFYKFIKNFWLNPKNITFSPFDGEYPQITPLSYVVDKVVIKKITIAQTPVNRQRIMLGELNAQSIEVTNSNFLIKKLNLKSGDIIDIALEEYQNSKESNKPVISLKRCDLIVQPKYIPELQDKVILSFYYQEHDFSFDLNNAEIKLKGNQSNFAITITNLSPSKYFTSLIPIDNFNLSLVKENNKYVIINGQIKLGEQTVEIDKGQILKGLLKGKPVDFNDLEFQFDMNQFLTLKPKKFKYSFITKSTIDKKDVLLAKMFFNKSIYDLSEQQYEIHDFLMESINIEQIQIPSEDLNNPTFKGRAMKK